jgi:hypothetical protein
MLCDVGACVPTADSSWRAGGGGCTSALEFVLFVKPNLYMHVWLTGAAMHRLNF